MGSLEILGCETVRGVWVFVRVFTIGRGVDESRGGCGG